MNDFEYDYGASVEDDHNWWTQRGRAPHDELSSQDQIGAILNASASLRPPVRPMKARVAGSHVKLGCDRATEVVGALVSQYHMPILGKGFHAHGGHAHAHGNRGPRFVRVDSEPSYLDWRDDWSDPSVASLERRLDELERAFAAHQADPHAHSAVLGAIAEKMDDAVAKIVPVPAPPGLACAWVDGDKICVSMRVPGKGGPRILSTTEPLASGIDDAAAAAALAGFEPEYIEDALPSLGAICGATAALKQMAASVPAIARLPQSDSLEPFLVQVEQKVSPGLAAVVRLLDRQRLGDPRAKAEVKALFAADPETYRQGAAIYNKVVHEHGKIIPSLLRAAGSAFRAVTGMPKKPAAITLARPPAPTVLGAVLGVIRPMAQAAGTALRSVARGGGIVRTPQRALPGRTYGSTGPGFVAPPGGRTYGNTGPGYVAPSDAAAAAATSNAPVPSADSSSSSTQPMSDYGDGGGGGYGGDGGDGGGYDDGSGDGGGYDDGSGDYADDGSDGGGYVDDGSSDYVDDGGE